MYRKSRRRGDGSREPYGHWIVKIRWQGRQRQTTTGTEDQQAAEAMEVTVKSLRERGLTEVLEPLFSGLVPLNRVHRLVQDHGLEGAVEPVLAEVHAAQNPDSWNELVDEFLRSARTVSESTKPGYRRPLLEYADFVKEELGGPASAALHLTMEHVERFKYWHRDRRLSDDPDQGEVYSKNSTTNNALIAVQAFCTYLMGVGVLRGKNPARAHRKGLPHGVARLPRRDEDDPSPAAKEFALIRAAAKRVEEARGPADDPYPGLLLWDVLANTGFLVYKECIEQLTPLSFNLLRAENEVVPVSVTGTKNAHRTRTVYVHESLARRVHEYARKFGIKPNELLFSTRAADGGRAPFSPAAVLRAWQEALAGVDEGLRPFVEHYRPFHLRHAFARYQVESGVTLTTLNRLMGHSPKSIVMTNRYARYRPADEARAAVGAMAAKTGLAG